MKKTLYITEKGVIYKKDNTIYFQNKNIKKVLPINNFTDIICLDRVTVKSGASYFLMSEGIPVHFFNKFGFYVGSLFPNKKLVSGNILIKQVQHYLDPEKRKYIALEMVNGIKHNLEKVIKQYDSSFKLPIKSSFKNVSEILGYESTCWKIFYEHFGKVLKKFSFRNRERNPPGNEINSLISYGNMILYSICLTEIYNSFLDPTISYLHEPFERRFSLALDLADVFKPVLVFRTITYLTNKKIISEEHFENYDNMVLLNKKGKKIFLKYFDEKLKSTIYYSKLKRKVSYRQLIRIECYKLIKHLIGDKKYESFKIWW